jgi:hypothetical protein
VLREIGARVVTPSHHAGVGIGYVPPEPVGRVRQPEVDVPVVGERIDDLQLSGRESGGTKDGDPFGQLHDGRLVANPVTRCVQALGWALDMDVVTQPVPQLRLPGVVGVEFGA